VQNFPVNKTSLPPKSSCIFTPKFVMDLIYISIYVN